MSPNPANGDLLAWLERLASLDSEQREHELSLLESEDPGTAKRLLKILTRADEAEQWFDHLETGIGRTLAAELDTAWAPGRVVGPYRLERLLATGGMGAVFLARKADGELKRPVALKLVPQGLIDDSMLQRFRTERDLLASLSHPNIAQLLDAGIDRDGQPWIAMEYIEGHDLLSWCRSRTAGLEQRVRVLVDLVSAVRFALRNLVVHGDLKPGNVRVDESGRLRLLDFGIARLFSGSVTAGQALNEQAAFTAGYAAPELLAGHGSTVASDIYALGAILRELIAVPVTTRGRQPARELELIVRCATPEDPLQRYESAHEFGQELRRWLTFQPVDARGGGRLYRFGKRLRRHPWASAGIALAAVALIGFGGYSRIQAQRFAEQRDSARQLATFMEQVFLGVDQESARDGTLSARALLDRGLARLQPDLSTTAPARAVGSRFASIMGRTYQRLGDYPTAERLLNQALENGALDAQSRLEVLLELADNHLLAGRFEQAETAFESLLDQTSTNAGRARVLAGLARTLSQTGRASEAVALLDESIALTRANPDTEPWRLAQRLNDAGSARFQLG